MIAPSEPMGNKSILKMSLLDFLEKYYLLEHNDIIKATIQNMRASLKTFNNFLGRTAVVSDLNKIQVMTFRNWMSQDFAPHSVNNKTGDVLALWYCAADYDILPTPSRIKKRKLPQRFPVVWTLDEMNRLFKATDLLTGKWEGIPKRMVWKLTFSLIWNTATRIGALLKAKFTDVNLETGQWYVPAENMKGGTADRFFPLRYDTLELIKRSAKYPRAKLVPLPKCRQHLYDLFNELLDLAGLPKDRWHKFHCIRRTAETMVAAKRGVAWAAEAVGHSEAIARRFYIHPDAIQRPKLIDALPSLDGKLKSPLPSMDAVASPVVSKRHHASLNKRQAAEVWLRDLLSERPMIASRIFELGKAAGHGRKALKEAKESIRIFPRKVGFAGNGCWYWDLPDVDYATSGI